MGVIIDTSIWVDVERGHLSPADVADLTGEEPVYIAPPVLAELEYGVNRAKTKQERNRRASAVARIRNKPCLVIDRDTADIFGKIAADLDDTGRATAHRVQDLWLAALAIQRGMKILTQNEKDFADVPGLSLMVMPSRPPNPRQTQRAQGSA